MKYRTAFLSFVLVTAAGGAALAHPPYAQGDWGHHGMMGSGGMGHHGMMGGPGMMGHGMMMGPRSRNPKMMATMMIAMMDTDGDQEASFDEIVTVHKRMFDMVDENKNGKISREEAAAFLGRDDKTAMEPR